MHKTDVTQQLLADACANLPKKHYCEQRCRCEFVRLRISDIVDELCVSVPDDVVDKSE